MPNRPVGKEKDVRAYARSLVGKVYKAVGSELTIPEDQLKRSVDAEIGRGEFALVKKVSGASSYNAAKALVLTAAFAANRGYVKQQLEKDPDFDVKGYTKAFAPKVSEVIGIDPKKMREIVEKVYRKASKPAR